MYYYAASNKVVTKFTLSAILTWREGFNATDENNISMGAKVGKIFEIR